MVLWIWKLPILINTWHCGFENLNMLLRIICQTSSHVNSMILTEVLFSRLWIFVNWNIKKLKRFLPFCLTWNLMGVMISKCYSFYNSLYTIPNMYLNDPHSSVFFFTLNLYAGHVTLLKLQSMLGTWHCWHYSLCLARDIV